MVKKGYTMFINMWKQYDLLKHSISHYTSCRGLDSVHIEDSLNNRFKEIKNSCTDVAFSIDDDIIFPCSSLEFAFSVWRSAPDTMVGFVPRIHLIHQSRNCEDIAKSFLVANATSAPPIWAKCNSIEECFVYRFHNFHPLFNSEMGKMGQK
ncbi:putative hexosyltransferase [Helianthus anomalus]